MLNKLIYKKWLGIGIAVSFIGFLTSTRTTYAEDKLGAERLDSRSARILRPRVPRTVPNHSQSSPIRESVPPAPAPSLATMRPATIQDCIRRTGDSGVRNAGQIDSFVSQVRSSRREEALLVLGDDMAAIRWVQGGGRGSGFLYGDDERERVCRAAIARGMAAIYVSGRSDNNRIEALADQYVRNNPRQFTHQPPTPAAAAATPPRD